MPKAEWGEFVPVSDEPPVGEGRNVVKLGRGVPEGGYRLPMNSGRVEGSLSGRSNDYLLDPREDDDADKRVKPKIKRVGR